MVALLSILELLKVYQSGKIVKVEHRVVLAVLAEERNVLTEIHILQVICDKAAVASLDAAAKLVERLLVGLGHLLHDPAFR